MSDNQIVPQPEFENRLGIIIARTPHDVIIQATAIAKELAEIVKKNNLSTNIKGKNFVRVEGWSTMGAMLGVLPREVSDLTRRFDDGSYEAVVELIRISDGAVIGRGSALVGMDEIWRNRAEYARRSMAVTRATGKAYRLGFSWIMALAGYEPTPAEEMGDVTEGEYTEHKDPPKQSAPVSENHKSNGKTTPNPVGALVEAGIAENAHEAAAIVNLSPFPKGNMTIDALVAWGKLYRGWRDLGEETKNAASKATAGEIPQ